MTNIPLYAASRISSSVEGFEGEEEKLKLREQILLEEKQRIEQ